MLAEELTFGNVFLLWKPCYHIFILSILEVDWSAFETSFWLSPRSCGDSYGDPTTGL